MVKGYARPGATDAKESDGDKRVQVQEPVMKFVPYS